MERKIVGVDQKINKQTKSISPGINQPKRPMPTAITNEKRTTMPTASNSELIRANPSPPAASEWIESKKGWVYERKRHLLISKQLIPRWMVLYSKPIPSLALYEQRSDAKPPYAPLVHYNLTEIDVVLQQGTDSSGNASVSVDKEKSDKIKRSSSVIARNAAKIKEFVAPTKSSKPLLQVSSTLPGSSKLLTLAVESDREAQDWLTRITNERLAYQQSLFKVDPIIEQANQQNMELRRLQEKELRLPGTAAVVVSGGIMDALIGNLDKRPNETMVAETTEIESLLGEMTMGVNKDDASDDPEASIPFGSDYLMALSRRYAATSDKDRLRWELEAERVRSRFGAVLIRHAIRLIDNYHRQDSPHRQSLGHSIQLELLTGYGDEDVQDEAEILDADLALKNELLAQAYVSWQTKVPLLTPLMQVIEYKGFRMLGYCPLALSDASCVYDGSRPQTTSPEHGMMEKLAKTLYLGVPYTLPEEPAEVAHFMHPAVQLHRIKDDAGVHPAGFYVSNLHLILPAPPAMNGRRLRPELLQQFRQQQGCDDLAPEKAAQAVEYMLGKVMRELVDNLESNLQIVPTESRAWTQLLHGHGINCCLMGIS
jgi:hypothetical protein